MATKGAGKSGKADANAKKDMNGANSMRDPLNKWFFAAEQVRSESIDAIDDLEDQVKDLQKALSKPGLDLKMRRALYASLAVAKEELKRSQEREKVHLAKFKQTGNLKQEAALKLKDLKSLIKANQDPGLTKYAKITQQLLSQLVKDANKLGSSKASNEKIMKTLSLLDKTTAKLPDQFKKTLAETSKIFELAQEEQSKQLEKMNSDFGKAKDLLLRTANAKRERWKERGMNVADKIGIGGLNVGNAFRGYQKLQAWKKEKENIKAAKSIVQALEGKQGVEYKREEESREPEMVDILKDYVKENKMFNRRALREMNKKNRENASGGAGGLNLGSLATTIGSLLTGGGIAKILKDIAGTVLSGGKVPVPTVPGTGGPKVPGRVPGAKPSAGSSVLRGASNVLRGMAAPTTMIGATALPAAAAAAFVLLSKQNKEEIEANPNDPKYKNNAYAMYLRGEATSVAAAGAKNQQSALRTLQPGTAREYLKLGPDKDGKFADGYTQKQLENMAKGLALDTGVDEPAVTPRGVTMPSTGAGAGRGSFASYVGQASDPNIASKEGGYQGVDSKGQVPTAASLGPGETTVTPTTVSTPMPSAGSRAPSASYGDTLGDGKVNTGKAVGASIRAQGNVNLDGLQPGVRTNLEAMAGEYERMTGKKLPINSAFRSIEDQARLYRTMPPGKAAPPGSSLHNFGYAFDTNSSTGEELDKLGLLNKFGFSRPIPSEKWHVQPAGMAVSAAKNGLFSADAPTNQGAQQGRGTQVASSKPQAQAISASDMSRFGPGSGGINVASAGGSGGSRGTISAPSQNSVKDIPLFDTSDGSFLALNMGVL
jgi:D-alanyl-D-alanine carboxypeptidase